MLEQLLNDFEKECGCRLTLHDLANVFQDAEGKSLLKAGRSSHRQRLPVCAAEERRYCVEHCMNQINRRICRRRETGFIKHCRSGVIEVVAPIFRDHVHVATLFAGQWRSRHADVPAELPVAGPEKLQRLRRLLPIFGIGLLEATERRRHQGRKEFSRAAEIREFIAARAHQDIALQALARKLGLSPSRTCHLVNNIFGKPFGVLLAEERIERARQLLIGTDYLMHEIAVLTGFGSAEHFSRMFRRHGDMTPGEYRRRYRLNLD